MSVKYKICTIESVRYEYPTNWEEDLDWSINTFYIWTDGENYYYSYNDNQKILNTITNSWDNKIWNGLSTIQCHSIWTDGNNIYYSSYSNQYILDISTSTWNTKTWNGLTSFNGNSIWTDGENIYCSFKINTTQKHYILDKSTSTWNEKTWNGFTDFSSSDCIWTDGNNIYYSYSNTQYILDKTTSTWSQKIWNNLPEYFYGQNVWSDGINIYYSSGTTQLILNKTTSTWVNFDFDCPENLNGNHIININNTLYCSSSYSIYKCKIGGEAINSKYVLKIINSQNNYNSFCINDKEKEFAQPVPVLTGGEISLSNGDTLIISEKDAPIEDWSTYGEDASGVFFALNSGHFMSIFLIPINSLNGDQSGFNGFFDMTDSRLYSRGTIIKVYDLGAGPELYDFAPSGEPASEMIQSEDYLHGLVPIVAVLIINNNDEWELVTDDYQGQSIQVGNEIIWISSISKLQYGEIGIYFTRSSGKNTIGYYNRNGSTIAQTVHYWFGSVRPEEDDEIHLYDLDEDDYSILQSEGNYLESEISEQVDLLVAFKYTNGSWVII